MAAIGAGPGSVNLAQAAINAAAAAKHAQQRMHSSQIAAETALRDNAVTMRAYYEGGSVDTSKVRRAVQALEDAAMQAVQDADAVQTAVQVAKQAADTAGQAIPVHEKTVTDLEAERSESQKALEQVRNEKRAHEAKMGEKQTEIEWKTREIENFRKNPPPKQLPSKQRKTLETLQSSVSDDSIRTLQAELEVLTPGRDADELVAGTNYRDQSVRDAEKRSEFTKLVRDHSRAKELTKLVEIHRTDSARTEAALKSADEALAQALEAHSVYVLQLAAVEAMERMRRHRLDAVVRCGRSRSHTAPADYYPPIPRPDIRPARQAREAAFQARNRVIEEEPLVASAQRELADLLPSLERRSSQGWLESHLRDWQEKIDAAKRRIKRIDELSSAIKKQEDMLNQIRDFKGRIESLEQQARQAEGAAQEAAAAVTTLQLELTTLGQAKPEFEARLEAANRAVTQLGQRISEEKTVLQSLRNATADCNNAINSECEMAYRAAADCYECADGGHSIQRHGVAQVEELESRVTTGYFRGLYSPTNEASVFASYEEWVKTRADAISRALRQRREGSYAVRRDHRVGTRVEADRTSAQKRLHLPDGSVDKLDNGNFRMAYVRTNEIECRGSRTNIVRDSVLERYRVVQHFPE
jgi:uncharacterized coiled-coil DUF342 family protein